MTLNVLSQEITMQNIALENVIIKPSQKKEQFIKYANIVHLFTTHPHLKRQKEDFALVSVSINQRKRNGLQDMVLFGTI